MKVIYLKVAIGLIFSLSASLSYGGAIACYHKETGDFCGFPTCPEQCEPRFPHDNQQVGSNQNQDWFGIFRSFSNAKYDERGRFVGSEKHQAQDFSCEFQTREELKQYLDRNPEERGQGKFGGYYVNWQATIPVEEETSIGHQSLSYGALVNLFENPSKVGHNQCWVTNDPFYLLRDSEEELTNEALVCQTTRENILIRVSKTNEENLFRRVYINKKNGHIFPSTKQWLKKCR